jgi:hypothetical protein
MSARRRISSDGDLALRGGRADEVPRSDDAAAAQGSAEAPPLALKSCLLAEEDVRLGRMLGSGSQGQVFEAAWRGHGPVAVKVLSEAFPRHMLGRKGSGDIGKMLQDLEGALPACCLVPAMLPEPTKTRTEAPLPPDGRTPPDAHKLALLRELSIFTTWCASCWGKPSLVHADELLSDAPALPPQPAPAPG